MAEVRAGRVSFQDFEQQENRGRELGPCSMANDKGGFDCLPMLMASEPPTGSISEVTPVTGAAENPSRRRPRSLTLLLLC
jgi:hypothetical protein